MTLTRRALLLTVAGAGACAARTGRGQASDSAAGRQVHTVGGPVPAERLGVTLMHEHVLVDFIGADQVSPSRYDAKQAFAAVLPHLQRARTLGCETLVECTPAYLGRDVTLLRRLSDASGVRILTNTGYYGAAKDKHLPRQAFTETAEQLAARWIREFEAGIDGTGTRPAFMKIGVDEAPLSQVDAKLVRAAALTHQRTGLPIASHTSTGLAAMEELDLLENAGVSPTAFIWIHAHNERDRTFHRRAAQRGAWVEFDGIGPATVPRHVELVRGMKEESVLDRVLVSQDAGWYHVGEAEGGQFRPYDTVFTTFVPSLMSAGLTDQDIRRLLVLSPARALAGDRA